MSDQGTHMCEHMTTAEIKSQPASPTAGGAGAVEVNHHRHLISELRRDVRHAYDSIDLALTRSEIILENHTGLYPETRDRLALSALMAEVARDAAKLAAKAAFQATKFAIIPSDDQGNELPASILKGDSPEVNSIFQAAGLASEDVSLGEYFVSTSRLNEPVKDALDSQPSLQFLQPCPASEGSKAAQDANSSKIESNNISIFQLGSKEEQIAEATTPELLKTKLVGQFKDMGDTSLLEAQESLESLTVVTGQKQVLTVNAEDGKPVEAALVADTKFKDMGNKSLHGGPVERLEPATPLSEVNQEMEPSDGESSKIQPGSKTEKEDQIVDDDTLVGRLQYYSKTHKFWETQPVAQFKDIGDTSLPEGPIDPATLVSEVKPEPYNLPALFEWSTCDMNSDDVCSEVYKFLKENYPDDGYLFMVEYSREFLRWALCPPGYYQSWHIGVRVKSNKKLVAFISGVPERIRVRDEVVKMAKVNFLCVHKKNLRSKRLAPVLIKELTRRVHLQNVWQAAYTSFDVLPIPVATCQYWGRMLNPKKLIDVGYTKLRENMTKSRTVKLYQLPDAPITPGFREMERRYVPAVTELLRNYLSQFGVATEFDGWDVEHWLLPRQDVVHSYLVVSPETHDVTDFCSFYSVPFTILGTPNNTVECCYAYYNVATVTSFPQLMKDALIVSKQKGFDIFYALDVMDNDSFLKNLIFSPGDDAHLYYYLYNYRLRTALKPSELGVVLW